MVFRLQPQDQNRNQPTLQQIRLARGEFLYLIIVDEHPGISQNYLIQTIQREQSIVTKHINHLVADGWLRKDVAKTTGVKTNCF